MELTVIINILCFFKLKFRCTMTTSDEGVEFDFLVHFIYMYVKG
jgi:hypothetical protein